MISTEMIIELLHEFKPEMSLEEQTELFDSGLIDSLTIFSELLPRLTKNFKIEISPLDLVPENFNTPAAITEYVNRVRGN